MDLNKIYDLIVVGAGAAGIVAAITAARDGKKVLLIEQLPQIATKLKATGGGRCNLSNTLSNEEFISSFGKNGRFISKAIELFDHKVLINFFKDIGVETSIADGFRIFPSTHSSSTVIDGLLKELQRLDVDIVCNTKALEIITKNNSIESLKTNNGIFNTKNILLSTGGKGYPKLGATADGYDIASKLGHKITTLHPAMMPLFTKESWQYNCRANTIPKAIVTINIHKKKKIKAVGDLIFTKNGLRGPVILDFAREITPFLQKYYEVPILINMVKGKTQNDIIDHFKLQIKQNSDGTILDHLSSLLPTSIIKELCKIVDVDYNLRFSKLEGRLKERLVNIVVNTPFTIIGHDGFKMAMITRGGISLKQIDPNTMQSKLIDGLYFAGEIVDIDGPCGGYNLQYSFASGNLAGKLLK